MVRWDLLTVNMADLRCTLDTWVVTGNKIRTNRTGSRRKFLVEVTCTIRTPRDNLAELAHHRCTRIYQVRDRKAKDTAVQGLELPEEASRLMSRVMDLAKTTDLFHKAACFLSLIEEIANCHAS